MLGLKRGFGISGWRFIRNVTPAYSESNLYYIMTIANIYSFQIELEFGHNIGLPSKLNAEVDATLADLYSFWDKVMEHDPVSIFSLGFMPSSIRMSSAKIVTNPVQFESKELSFNFSLGILCNIISIRHYYRKQWSKSEV